MSKRAKITKARFDELMAHARFERYLGIDELYSDRVPEHIDRAAERAFHRMEAWIAAGAIPGTVPEPPTMPKAAGAAAAMKATSIALASAVLIGVGSYCAVPAVREAVNGCLGIKTAISDASYSAKSPADYVIPSPGDGYELREQIDSDTVKAGWFVAERRLLMVQIAPELQELPTGEGEVVVIGSMVGTAYEIDGDRQLLLYDGGMTILIRMYNADRQELLDYAELFEAANRRGSQNE